jgi:hypothetical protein
MSDGSKMFPLICLISTGLFDIIRLETSSLEASRWDGKQVKSSKCRLNELEVH